MKRWRWLFAAGWLGSAWAQGAPPATPLPDLSIAQALQKAESASPELKAAVERERAAEENIRVLRSFYLPTVDAEAIDSFGFPGSSRDLGMSGLAGSSYRSGPTVALNADLDLYNPARRYAVRRAQMELTAVKAETQVARYQVDQRALEAYMEAARSRGKADAYQKIIGDVGRVESEVDRFVKTGQRSVVERLLVHDQTTDAEMTAAAYGERYRVALERLAVLTGSSTTALSCQTPQMIPEAGLGLLQGAPNPLVQRAAAQAAAARADVDVQNAQYDPRLVATASVGDMDKVRLVQRHDYSGGFGVRMPIFNGGRIRGTVRQAEALAAAQDDAQQAVRFDIDQLNVRYDETIASSRVQLDFLNKEVDDASRAFRLAKQRYVDFQGTLVDVREALRNRERVESEVIDVKADLLLALGSKMLMNGGVPR